MSRSMHVRVPPVAPALLDVMNTERVESLVWEALFDPRHNAWTTPEESLSSTDEGMTGGCLLQAKGTGRTFLDGALFVLESDTSRQGQADAADLRAFLAALDKHGALLITLEH